MKHVPRKQIEAEQLRDQIMKLLAEPDGWVGYASQRYWLRTLLRKDKEEVYSDRQRAGVDRMIYARTFFDGWAGYSVQELVREARQYIADFGYEDELFLNRIKHATRLIRGDMGALVGLCRTAGMDIPPFHRSREEPED